MSIQQKSDREKFYDLLIKEQEKFYRLAYSYVKNKEAALDVVQEATANGLVNFDKLRQKEYMKTWFYRILINCAITYLRKNDKYVYDEDIILQMPQEQNQTGQEEKIDLYQAVMRLDIKYRTVIVLRYFEDLKISEVAQVMQLPENTIKTRIRTALSTLSKFLEVDVNYV